jgi:hypothetical protein
MQFPLDVVMDWKGSEGGELKHVLTGIQYGNIGGWSLDVFAAEAAHTGRLWRT